MESPPPSAPSAATRRALLLRPPSDSSPPAAASSASRDPRPVWPRLFLPLPASARGLANRTRGLRSLQEIDEQRPRRNPPKPDNGRQTDGKTRQNNPRAGRGEGVGRRGEGLVGRRSRVGFNLTKRRWEN